jgi:hypothetical protein
MYRSRRNTLAPSTVAIPASRSCCGNRPWGSRSCVPTGPAPAVNTPRSSALPTPSWSAQSVSGDASRSHWWHSPESPTGHTFDHRSASGACRRQCAEASRQWPSRPPPPVRPQLVPFARFSFAPIRESGMAVLLQPLPPAEHRPILYPDDFCRRPPSDLLRQGLQKHVLNFHHPLHFGG